MTRRFIRHLLRGIFCSQISPSAAYRKYCQVGDLYDLSNVAFCKRQMPTIKLTTFIGVFGLNSITNFLFFIIYLLYWIGIVLLIPPVSKCLLKYGKKL